MIKRGADFSKPQSHKKRNIFWFISIGKKKFIEVKELLKGIFMGFVFSCVFLLGFYALAAYPTTAYSPGDTLNPSCAAGSANCTVISPIPYTGATSNVDLGSKTITTTGAGSLGSLTLTTTALTPAYGGTGLSSLTTYAVLTGGTTSTGNLQQVSGLGTSGQVLTSNGAGALPSWQAATGGTAPSVIQGRLTLTTAVPVTTSDVTAATTVYFTPYNGDKIALYDGSTWAISAFTEKSINTTDSQSCTTTFFYTHIFFFFFSP